MGLLDEAIRDHLELKRRRGADPTEIARAEREALEPVFPGEAPDDADVAPDAGEAAIPVEHAAHAGDVDLIGADAAHAGEPVVGGEIALPEGSVLDPAHEAEALPHDAPHEPGVDAAFAELGQETAELDVEAYMQAEAQGAPHDAAHAAPAAGGEDELLEWEEPSRHAEPPPEQIPGQERLSLE